MPKTTKNVEKSISKKIFTDDEPSEESSDLSASQKSAPEDTVVRTSETIIPADPTVSTHSERLEPTKPNPDMFWTSSSTLDPILPPPVFSSDCPPPPVPCNDQQQALFTQQESIFFQQAFLRDANLRRFRPEFARLDRLRSRFLQHKRALFTSAAAGLFHAFDYALYLQASGEFDRVPQEVVVAKLKQIVPKPSVSSVPYSRPPFQDRQFNRRKRRAALFKDRDRKKE